MDTGKKINRFPSGTVRVPPSKSLAHRALICAALAEGESRISGLELSQDILATRAALAQLMVDDGQSAVVDCRESGSTLRFMIPIAAALGLEAKFTGSGRLMERPMTPYQDIVQGFTQTKDAIRITGDLSGSPYTLPGNVSSQFVSGLLMALPLTGQGGEIRVDGTLESSPYVALTIEVMRLFSVDVEQDGFRVFRIAPGQTYKAAEYTVEGDFSQAAFFLVAGALGRPVECLGLPEQSLQGDRAILDILRQCGAEVQTGPNGGPVVTAQTLRAVSVDVSEIPDLVPILAVLFSFCEGESRIFGAARLRLKESDRLAAISTELNKLGGKVEQGGDTLKIQGVKALRGGEVDAWNDHRIAMALAVAAIRCDGQVILRGSEAVNKSYPSFWQDFERGGL